MLMDGKQIQLLGMDGQHYGISISRMYDNYILDKESDQDLLPHRHHFYSLFLQKNGSLSFEVDNQRIEVIPSSLLLINPGQVHHCHAANNISGWSSLLTQNILTQRRAMRRDSTMIG